MVPCAAIGDSIAVGVGQARPECSTTAQVGITSERYITSLLPLAETGADTTIISLGVNDDDSVDTLSNLRRVRREVKSKAVFWLLPGIKERVRDDIATVAQENGDRLIDTRPQAGRDHLHPSGAGYLQIAAQTYGGGSVSSYAAYQPSYPVEVAEAPAHLSLPGEPAFRINYSEVPASHSRHSASSDWVFINTPRRLSAMATPRERIRNLRATRRYESASLPISYSHTTAQRPVQASFASASRGPSLSASHSVGPNAHVAGLSISHANLPVQHANLPMQHVGLPAQHTSAPAERTGAKATSHASSSAAPHPAIVRATRTVQACAATARACNGGRSIHG